MNVALVDSNITEILADQGRLAEADELIAGATATWAAADDPWGVGVAQRAQGIIAARSGRFADAATLLEASRATLDRIGAKLDVASTELAFAELNLHRGDGHAALADVARAETMGAADNLGPALLRLHGVALLQVGAFAEAGEQLETALADARARQRLRDRTGRRHPRGGRARPRTPGVLGPTRRGGGDTPPPRHHLGSGLPDLVGCRRSVNRSDQRNLTFASTPNFTK